MNDNTATILQPVSFQNQELTDDISDDALMFRYRITLTDFLNKVRLGQRHITPEITRAIQYYNQTAAEYGYSRIEYDI